MKPIKSIEKELADCRQAFAEHPNAKLVWCCHHEVLVEKLTEPVENRISYILSNKPQEEQAVRFRNFRPVKDEVTTAKSRDDYNIAIAKALEDYQTAVAKPREVCDAANAKALEGCKTAIAKPKEDCQTAIAKALEDYQTAVAKPREVCDAACKLAEKPLVDLLNQEWPDHTWNGKSIF